jgi:hypothetical protein
MGELVAVFQQTRAKIEHASRAMQTRGVAKGSRKALARALSEAAIGVVDQAIEMAHRTEALAAENADLRARLEAAEQDHHETEEPLL